MIEVKYLGRLANNLFQYSLGRILAEELGFSLSAEAIHGFPKTSEPIQGRRFSEPESIYAGQSLDLDAILNDKSPRHITLEGYFQRYEYYRPYRTRIRNWLEFSPDVHVIAPTTDLTINVRRTDYIFPYGWALPFSYYHEAIRRLLPEGGRLSIVTDDSNDPFFKRFREWDCEFFHGDPIEQLLFMAKSKRLVLSQSTFSWWPTFLSSLEQEVVCPAPNFGIWGDYESPTSSCLVEKDRFVCIPCNEPYVPLKEELSYQHRRLLKRKIIVKVNTLLRLSRLDRLLGWKLKVPNL
jgi:hypothetical protein